MDVTVHKEVTYTLELSSREMELLHDVVITYHRELLDKLPTPPNDSFIELERNISDAVREGRL